MLIRLVLALLICLGVATTAHADSAVMGDAPPGGYEGTFGPGMGAGSVDIASGTARASYPIEVPAGRAGIQPNLALTYAHTRGPDIAGEGWTLDLPTLEVRGLAGGPPRFDADSHLELSRAELVQVCPAAPCQGELTPGWATGWAMYRPRVETVSTRVFGAPKFTGSDGFDFDRMTFRLTKSDGGYIEFGAGGAIDRDVSTHRIYRWNISSDRDSIPNSPNVVNYVWKHVLTGNERDRGRLEDIYYTLVSAHSEGKRDSGHHIHFDYVRWQDQHSVYPPMSLRRHDSVIRRVAISSMNGATARERVRVYELTYDSEEMSLWNRPFLTSVREYGRCATTVTEAAIGFDADLMQLPESNDGCSARDATRFEYSSEIKFNDYGTSWLVDNINTSGRDLRLEPNCGLAFPLQPKTLSREHAAIVDVDRDGLPDIIQQATRGNPIYIQDRTENSYRTFRCAYLDFTTSPNKPSPPPPYQFDTVPGFSASNGSLTVTGSWVFGAPTTTGVDGRDQYSFAYLLRPAAPHLVPNNPYLSVKVLQDGERNGRPVYRDEIAPLANAAQATGVLPHMMGDINGDGLVDVLTNRLLPIGPAFVSFSARTASGYIAPFAASTATNLHLPYEPAPVGGAPPVEPHPGRPEYGQLADMNGDGIQDYVTLERQGGAVGFAYLPGRGNGEFGCDPNGTVWCVPALGSPGRAPGLPGYGAVLDEVLINLVSSQPISIDQFAHFHDLNGDGRADYVSVTNATDHTNFEVEVFLNIDGRTFKRAVRQLVPITSGGVTQGVRVLFADMNGNGSEDLVLLEDVWSGGAHVLTFFDLETNRESGTGAPGLLTRIYHSGGATTVYRYKTLLEAERDSMDWWAGWGTPNPGDPDTGAWRSRSPRPGHVVSSVTTRSNSPVPYNFSSGTTYQYRDPVFDRWRGQLRGFRRTRAINDLEAVDTKYFFSECLRSNGPSSCNPEADSAEALQGLPIQSERLQLPNKYVSTTRYTYTTHRQGNGTALNRWYVYTSEVNTYLYDLVAQPPGQDVLPAVVARDVELAPIVEDTVLARAPWVRIRRRQVYDVSKKVVLDAYDYGRVEGGGLEPPPIDRPIHQQFTYAASVASAVWRLSRHRSSYDPGGTGQPLLQSWADPPVRETSFTYDTEGRLKTVKGLLNGSLPLQRRHEAGSPFADSPGPTLNGVEVTLESIDYDNYGNVQRARGPNGQCTETTYHAPYNDWPATSTTYLGENCGGQSSTAYFTFDRGLGKLTYSISPSLAQRAIEYDQLGRVSTIYGPRPDTAVGTIAETTFAYSPDTHEPVHWVKVTSLSEGSGSRESWHYVNSVGQPIASLERGEQSAWDIGPWLAHPAPGLDAHGRPVSIYKPYWFFGEPDAFSIVPSPGGVKSQIWYDAGRVVQIYRIADAAVTRWDHFALSVDKWDPENLQPGGEHYGAKTTTSVDGHGRVIHTEKFGAAPGKTEFEYLATGELVALKRSSSNPFHSYRRWRRFDSLGRMVENIEPNAVSSYHDDPNSFPASLKAWRYLYDGSGRLIGTSDPRGCGKNIFYDRASRLIAEDYSPCLVDHEPYSPVNIATGDGAEVFNTYDTQVMADQPFAMASKGRLTSISGRASQTAFAYDGRGRAVAVGARIAKPGTANASLAQRYTNHWFIDRTEFDEFDRPQNIVLGDDSPPRDGGEGQLSLHYSKRGVVTSVDGTYGMLFSDVRVDADGFVNHYTLGDVASTEAFMAADDNRRLKTFRLRRSPGPWTTAGGYVPPPAADRTLQGSLVEKQFEYDRVGNIKSMADGRNEAEWPEGAKPTATKVVTYDSQYRVTDVVSHHNNDIYVSPFAAEISGGDLRAAPHQSYASRVSSQQFTYDDYGNLLGAPQLPNGTIYDRGLSGVAMGHHPIRLLNHPNQLVSAGDGGQNELKASYDAAGNLIRMNLERPATQCVGPSQKCSQRYTYSWDEANHLTRVRRWDFSTLQSGPGYPDVPSGPADADMKFAYSGGGRVYKSDASEIGAPRYTVDVLPSLRLSQTTYDAATNDYDASMSVQRRYLGGLGEVVYDSTLPSTGSDRHVFLKVGDHLGSASVVIDKATSELVEYREYQAYGATDYDYRPQRWGSFRVDQHFTGKEEDVETGLTYFGARYYSAYLQRFISADPLTIHGWGADANPYAYVGGAVFNAVDPLGLQCWGAEQCGGGDPPLCQRA